MFLAGAVLYGLASFPLAAQDQPEVLTVARAVKIALANNRVLKITSLQLAGGLAPAEVRGAEAVGCSESAEVAEVSVDRDPASHL
jgi:hypothetical protein